MMGAYYAQPKERSSWCQPLHLDVLRATRRSRISTRPVGLQVFSKDPKAADLRHGVRERTSGARAGVAVRCVRQRRLDLFDLQGMSARVDCNDEEHLVTIH